VDVVPLLPPSGSLDETEFLVTGSGASTAGHRFDPELLRPFQAKMGRLA
jgi:hypothetical protein